MLTWTLTWHLTWRPTWHLTWPADMASNVTADVADDMAYFLAPGPLVIGPILELGCYDVAGDLIIAHL